MRIDLQLFNTHLLSALFQAGHKYFVRQTLPKEYTGGDAQLKACFLLTHYNDMKQVDIHLRNIITDPNKYLYDLDKQEDRQKIYQAALQPAGYKVYTPLQLKNTDAMVLHKSKLKKYIDHKLGWSPKKSDDVRALLSYAFGVFYIEFKWNSITAKVKADDVSSF